MPKDRTPYDAEHIASARWKDVLTLAYALAGRGRLEGGELHAYLASGAGRQEEARRRYDEWAELIHGGAVHA